jgi:lycopene beta-cyclase
MIQYDYVIEGAGASGLSLLMHMIRSNNFADKNVLLIDKAPKTQNDRTWCFWESGRGFFDDIVYRRWNKMWFCGVDGEARLHDIAPYQYKMIRGIDFYNYCLNEISRHKNISVAYGDARNMQHAAQYIFSSIPPKMPETGDHYFIWQHFKGWIIRTNASKFSADEATLMDFNIDQRADCSFVYVMPFSSDRALIEYTVFSDSQLEAGEYDEALRKYCSEKLSLAENDYTIEEQEFGMIPMTNYKFPASQGNVIYIGTAGGQTKASTGYTFKFIQQHSRQIVDALIRNENPVVQPANKKFDFYDSVLLKIMAEKKLRGADIFTSIFSKNKMRDVFKFLDNESAVLEDLKIMRTLPTATFMKAAIAHLAR